MVLHAIPFKQILAPRNAKLWGLFFQHFTFNWFSYTLLTELPSYMNDELGLDLTAASGYLVLIYLANFLGCSFGGALADCFVNRLKWPTVRARVVTEWSSFGFAAAFLLSVGYWGVKASQQGRAVGLMACATFCIGLAGGGFNVNFVEVAPNHAGALYAFSNFFANISGILTPLVTAKLVEGGGVSGWRNVFILAAALNVTAAVVWTFTATTSALIF